MSEIEERALEAARILRDFCGEWDCTICPFIEDVYCRLSQHPLFAGRFQTKSPPVLVTRTSPKGDGIHKPHHP